MKVGEFELLVKKLAERDDVTVEIKNLEYVINKMKKGEWISDVPIQRSGDAWKNERIKENLIMMIMTGDAGTFYISDYFVIKNNEVKGKIKLVYDGKQRTTRLQQVYDNQLPLPPSAVYLLTNGKTRRSKYFSELPPESREEFLNMKAIIEHHRAPEEASKSIELAKAWNQYVASRFYRLNRTGKPLTAFESFGALYAPDYKLKIETLKKKLSGIAADARKSVIELFKEYKYDSKRGRPISFSERELVRIDALFYGMKMEITSDGKVMGKPKSPEDLKKITATGSQFMDDVMENRQKLIENGYEESIDKSLEYMYNILKRGIEGAYMLFGPQPTRFIKELLNVRNRAEKEIFISTVLSLGFASKTELSRIVVDHREEVLEKMKKHFECTKINDEKCVPTRNEILELYTDNAENSTKMRKRITLMWQEVFKDFFPQRKPYAQRRYEANIENRKKRQNIPEDKKKIVVMDHQTPIAAGGTVGEARPRLSILDNHYEHKNGYL